MFHQVLRAAFEVHEHLIHSANVDHVHFLGLALAGHQGGSGNQLNSITERGLRADLGEQLHGVLGDLHVFFLTTDLQDLLDLILLVR